MMGPLLASILGGAAANAAASGTQQGKPGVGGGFAKGLFGFLTDRPEIPEIEAIQPDSIQPNYTPLYIVGGSVVAVIIAALLISK